MTEPRLFACSDAVVGEGNGRRVVRLNALGPDPNVNIKINDVAKIFLRELPARLVDLLEIAAYVFTADAGTSRGSRWEADSVEPWSRDLKFLIPVRDYEFWCREDVNAALQSCLMFLSNDAYDFQFARLVGDRPIQQFLELGQDNWPFGGTDAVTLFSGGLDSLAGAVETAVNGDNLVLVSHRPVATISKRQKDLVQSLKAKYPGIQLLHVPVWVNKKDMRDEPTQRTRSFLFAALGAVTAELVEAKAVRFFENGVVSLNLPVADEVLTARASRTTHPYAISLLERFVALVAERRVAIENPFIFKTKAEVVQSVIDRGAGELIGLTTSCAHTMFKSRTRQHCGTCSQCIDRRIAVLACGHPDLDPEIDYVTDVFTGNRAEGYEKNMAVHYARMAMEMGNMSEEQFATTFNLELTRAVRPFADSDAAASQFYEMYRRHSAAVVRVLTQEIEEHAKQLVSRTLSDRCLVALIAAGEHEHPAWVQYSDCITGILQRGLPRIRKKVPQTEPELQELCDAILAGHDDELIREFPFMRWSASATKPDWSKESFGLWVELKYVRKKSDVKIITDDLAVDVTKYGANGRRVLYVIYDPHHLIVDDSVFAAPIEAVGSMQVRFIR